VDKLVAELAADRSKFKELWLRRAECIVNCRRRKEAFFGLFDWVPCGRNVELTQFNSSQRTKTGRVRSKISMYKL
jgi:hypothetical protein